MQNTKEWPHWSCAAEQSLAQGSIETTITLKNARLDLMRITPEQLSMLCATIAVALGHAIHANNSLSTQELKELFISALTETK